MRSPMPANLRELAVLDDHAGERLDAFLHAHGEGLSRRDARRLCELGAVAIDGVRAPANSKLRAGQRVEFAAQTVPLSLALGLPVLHEDPDLLVLHKPPGLAVHKGPLIDDCVADRLAARLPGAGLAHRLDRGTSGLLLVGLHKEALRAFASEMDERAIGRDYLAIAVGTVLRDAETIDLPLHVTDSPRSDQPKVLVDRERGQPARTHVRVLERRSDLTLVALRLDTGRTHQIRAHLQAIGHPLLGDPRYGDPARNAHARATFGIDRPMLHSARLRFRRPSDGQELDLRAWHEPDFARVFRRVGESA